MSIGVFSIITNEKKELLLVKHTDYPLWDLPEGTLEDESLELCALREAYEETGYQIALDYKIGTFNRPKFKDTQHLFAATVESGKPLTTGPETKELRWFSLNRLPMAMIPNRRKQINCFKQGDKHIELTLTDNHPFLLIQRLFRR